MQDVKGIEAAAERLRLAMKHGAYVGYPGQREQDWHLLAELYLRELDQTPVDEEFARSVAVEERTISDRELLVWKIGAFSLLKHYGSYGDCPIHLNYHGSVLFTNPTIGQFWTACRLFNVEVKP